MQGLKGPVCSEEMGLFLIVRHVLHSGPGLLVGIMHTLILDLHPFSLGAALNPVLVVTPHLHLLSNMLGDIPVTVPFVELVLSLCLASDGNEIPYLPIGDNRMGSSMVHDSAQWGLDIHRWVRV